jgi:hypothetical protein
MKRAKDPARCTAFPIHERRDRNQTSRVYNENDSKAIYTNITSRHVKAFQNVASKP